MDEYCEMRSCLVQDRPPSLYSNGNGGTNSKVSETLIGD